MDVSIGSTQVGFEIKKTKKQLAKTSVVPPPTDDGSTLVNNAAAYYGLVVDLEGVSKNENELIRRYRETAQYADCNSAIEDIVNEAVVGDPDSKPVTVILDDLKVGDAIKRKIRDEFDEILKLYRFEEKGHDMFRQWYVDGRMFFHVIMDPKQPQLGIQELRAVDPRKIRRIKNVKKSRDPKTGVDTTIVEGEYYLYNDKGITEQTTQGIKLSVDSIISAPSGLLDSNNNMVLSYLHQAIKPTNMLKMMEDALVIYRISRAPERRIFYVDVGTLPKVRAEQYVNEIMNKFRNKIVYDAATGEIKDNRQHLSMMEDFWMPRREGGKGTEITTLAGGQNLSNIEDVQYFQQKLFQALNVPLSRLNPQANFSLGRASEITREEIKFNKFVERLRKKFAALFREALRVQLIAKGIINPDDWDMMVFSIRFDFQKDNYFTEMKNAEVLNNRFALLQNVDPFVGKYVSIKWVREKILQQTEEDMKDMDIEMEVDRETQLDFAAHEGELNVAKQEAPLEQQADHQKKVEATKPQPKGK